LWFQEADKNSLVVPENNSMNNAVHSIDVDQAIKTSAVRWFHANLVFWSFVVMLMDGFDQQMIGYVAPSIIHAWSIPRASFVPVFTTSMVGMMIGSTLGGSAADRWGRRRLLLTGMVIFGLLTAACGFTTSTAELSVVRFLAGIGVGFAVPNALALTAEYAPERHRAMLITIMFLGYSLGGAAGGWAAALLIPRFGWASIFFVGGVSAIVLVPACAFALPESIRFQLLRIGNGERARTILKRLLPDTAIDEQTRLIFTEKIQPGVPARHLFTEKRAVFTLLLWLCFITNLMTLTFALNWLPTVIADAGIALTRAVMVTSYFQVGGVAGGLILSRLLDRGTLAPLAWFFGLAAISIALIGVVGNTSLALDVVVCAAGVFVVGGQFGLNALASSAYPTFMRATGAGWALGVGRFGAVPGPIIGGLLIGLNLSPNVLFAYGAVPMLVACVAALVLARGPIRFTGRQALGARRSLKTPAARRFKNIDRGYQSRSIDAANGRD
jgi:AAHS family 4-hydroxybenzoate transporter-like MFS transporter